MEEALVEGEGETLDESVVEAEALRLALPVTLAERHSETLAQGLGEGEGVRCAREALAAPERVTVALLLPRPA